jgi:hypothetical protein
VSTIFQFNSGHAFNSDNIGAIRPIYKIAKTTRLNVVAGEEHIDATPSVLLETGMEVTVEWHLSQAGVDINQEDAPSFIVGKNSVMCKSETGSLVESKTFLKLDEEKQSHISKYLRAINALHASIKASFEFTTETSFNVEERDPKGVLAERTVGLEKYIDGIGITGTRYMYEDGEILVLEGYYELVSKLDSKNISLSNEEMRMLTELPLDHKFGAGSGVGKSDDAEDYSNVSGHAHADA